MSGVSTRLALTHEWLEIRTGSEKTFEAMAAVFPDADLFALTWDPAAPLDFGGRRPATTALDRLGPLRGRRRLQLPLMPLAWRYASRQRYDVVVTSSHACAKGFWPARQALHLCYCYTPMRYLWAPEVDARTRRSRLTSAPEWALRAWDARSVEWVDEFAAISDAIRARIEQFYGRPAAVIHPPVDTDFFTPGTCEQGEYVLAVSRLVSYKRLDLAIEACHALRYPLVIAGYGAEEAALRAFATELGASVTFVIGPGDEELRRLYRSARAVLFPSIEDFGIVAVEAQACGTPVLAVADGGSLDTVVHGVSGVLVHEQTAKAVQAGLEELLSDPPAAAACRRNAERFSTARFVEKFGTWVASSAARRGIDVVPAGAAALPR